MGNNNLFSLCLYLSPPQWNKALQVAGFSVFWNPTCASLLQFVGVIVDKSMELLVGDSFSSFSFVKIVLHKLSWNSFAKIAACFSGLVSSSVSVSQLQVMFLEQFPKKKQIHKQNSEMYTSIQDYGSVDKNEFTREKWVTSAVIRLPKLVGTADGPKQWKKYCWKEKYPYSWAACGKHMQSTP